MNENIHLLDEVDRFLDGTMTNAERLGFEALCKDNEEARMLLEEQITFRKYFLEKADREDLEVKLEGAYANWKVENQPSGKRKTMPIRSYLWKVAAVAAAVTLLITALGGWLFTQNNNKKSSYIILRREIDNIKRSQTALLNDIHQPKSAPAPAAPGAYGGTGFAIASNGYIVTNSHVVAGADSIYVQNNKGEGYKAEIVYQSPAYDLAVLKVKDSAFRLPAIPFSLKKTNAELGEEVYTLGYPRDEIVFGKGYISAETGFHGDSAAYQIAIPVNPGNSGGPLIDAQGHVVGIISGKQSPSDDIAFAVKSSLLLDMLDSVSQHNATGSPDVNRRGLMNKSTPLQHLNQVNQIKKIQDYIFLVKVYN